MTEIIFNKSLTIQYYSESGLPKRALESNTCAVCANPIIVQNNDEALIERTYKLQCGHTFVEILLIGFNLMRFYLIDFMNFVYVVGVLSEKNKHVLIVKKKLI